MMQIDCEVVDTRVVHLKDHASHQPVVNNETTYGSHAPAASATPQSERSQRQNAAATYVGGETEREIGYKYHPRNLTAPAVSPWP